MAANRFVEAVDPEPNRLVVVVGAGAGAIEELEPRFPKMLVFGASDDVAVVTAGVPNDRGFGASAGFEEPKRDGAPPNGLLDPEVAPNNGAGAAGATGAEVVVVVGASLAGCEPKMLGLVAEESGFEAPKRLFDPKRDGWVVGAGGANDDVAEMVGLFPKSDPVGFTASVTGGAELVDEKPKAGAGAGATAGAGAGAASCDGLGAPNPNAGALEPAVTPN